MDNINFYFRRSIAIIIEVIIAAAVLLAAYLVLAPAPKGVPVLEYHMVDDNERPDEVIYSVPPAEFAAQLDYLQQHGYTTMTMRDFITAEQAGEALPAKPIVLTFDDGYTDNYTQMLPILEAHGMKATMYMIAGRVAEPDYLTWAELHEMQENGVEIGSHTVDHEPLTGYTPAEQEHQLQESKYILESNGIVAVESFSYPNGKYDAGLPAILQRDGYRSAVTGDAGLNVAATNPYLLQRINIPHPRFGLTEFRLRLWKGEIMARLGIRQHSMEE